MYASPYPQPQMAPYGFVGDMLGAIGAPAGRVIGNVWGHGQLGEQVGGTVGAVAREFLPFSAMPQAQPQLAPYGVFGDIASWAAPHVGRLAGRALGNEQAGATAGQIAGGLAKFIPFNAGPEVAYAQPQMAPYGFVGDMLGAIGAPAGRVIGNVWGHGQLGEQVGGTVGAVAREFLPFSAMPQAQPQLAPYGVFGDIASWAAPHVGRLAGRALGNEQAGATAGQIAGGLAKFIPFNAGPEVTYAQQPQLAPYGIFGDIASWAAPHVGRLAGRALGNEQAGATAGQIAGGLAKFIPFNAGPEVAYAQPQMAPYGFVGDMLGAIGAPAGRVIGNVWGHGQLGEQVGGTVGAVAREFLPFSAMPQQAGGQMVPAQTFAPQPQLAPYGIGGAILGAFAPAAGSAIGGLFGNKQLGKTIGTIAGTALAFAPFSVGPGQVAYLPVETSTVH